MGLCTALGCAWLWLRTKAASAKASVGEKARRLPATIRSKTANVCTVLMEKLRAFRRVMHEARGKMWEYRRPVAYSLVIGLAVGGMGYLGGPLLSSLALGLCSSAISLAGFLAAPFVRLWKQLQGQAT
jgi:hypothetical protein